MSALLSLLLAATPLATPLPPARRVGVASVEIIQLEPVSVTPATGNARAADRQYRRRDAMPLVEFF
jgi:hypothetical protein